MGPLLLSLFLSAPADAHLVVASGLRLREHPDASAKVVATVGFGAVLPCEERSPTVVVGGRSGAFCSVLGYPDRWYFEPNTVVVAADAQAQLRAEIDKRLQSLRNVDASRFADVYDLQFFLLRHEQLDAVDDGERDRLVIDELDLVQSNPAAFVKDARLVEETPKGPRRLRTDVVDAALDGAPDDTKAAVRLRLGGTVAAKGPTPKTPNAVTLVAMSLGLAEAQIATLSTYQSAVAAHRKNPTGESWCALEAQAEKIARGLPTDRWTPEAQVYEPRFTQLGVALPGIDIISLSVGVVASRDFDELAALGPKDVTAVVGAVSGLIADGFSDGFDQRTDDQGCFDPGVFTAALERAATAQQTKVASCVQNLIRSRVAKKLDDARGWGCYCASRDNVMKVRPAFDRAAAKFEVAKAQPAPLKTDGHQFDGKCDF